MGKLISIKIKEEIKPLYDIEVDSNHNFVVNDGILIKNSEQYLSRESLCVLASLNAAKCSTIEEEYEEELEVLGESINRFLDNVNECEYRYETYATPHQKIAIEKLRRTGAGYTNLAGWLFLKNLEYGSPEGNLALEKFTERYNYFLYKNSIKLGKEKGSFGLFKREKFEQSPFVKRMMSLGLEFEAMRNCTCSSVAPTGCCTKETKIITKNKTMSFLEIFEENEIDIEKLENGNEEKKWFEPKKEIYAKNINGEYDKITKLYYNGYDVVKNIKFEDNSIISATPIHKVLVKINEEEAIWKEIDLLEIGDEVLFLE